MFSFKTTPGDSGKRLDRYLQEKTGLTRKKVKALLDKGRVFVRGRKVIIASWEVEPEGSVEVRDQSGGHPEANKYFLKVAYEDPDILVVDKDAGIPCEESPVAVQPTIIEIINAYYRRKFPAQKKQYVAAIHRLDRETSGLMVFSKSPAANRLAHQFRNHTIQRKYLSIVSGAVEQNRGTIKGYLQKGTLLKGGKKVKPATPESGRRAITHWRVVERYPNASLLEVTLNTGRTHQIRVHLAEMGHPVVGDKIYGGERVTDFPRQALHASYLGFRHPISGKEMEFESNLPKDMRKLVDQLRDSS